MRLRKADCGHGYVPEDTKTEHEDQMGPVYLCATCEQGLRYITKDVAPTKRAPGRPRKGA